MILSEYVRIHGDGGWRNLPKKAGEFQQISYSMRNADNICIERLISGENLCCRS